MMRKLFLGMAAVLAASTTALAADLPVARPMPAALPVPVIFSWTGCYIGIQGGGNWGRSEHIARSGPNPSMSMTGDFALSGGIAGGTIGCNFQTSNFVIGIEDDFSWTNKKGSVLNLPPFATTTTTSTREKWIDTLRLRFGYVPWDTVLVYGTAGVAFAGTTVTDSGPAFGSVSDTKSRTGWTAGAGAEWAAWTGASWALTFKLEYLHAEFDIKQYFVPPVAILGTTIISRDVKLRDDMVRIGMNLKFNWGGPIVANY